MHHNRNAEGDPAPRRANTPPPAGNVHGLDLVDALRIDLHPAQLPWLAVEVDILRYCLEDELAHLRARHDQRPQAAKKDHRPSAREADEELERRAYQLQVLAMLAEQMPISGQAAAAATASSWSEPAGAPEPERTAERVAVVAPAALMTVLIRGATRHATDALGEALRGPGLDVDHHTDSGGGWRGPELPRVTPTIAAKLRATAEAARAFTDTYLHVLAHQTYSFDPGYDPIHAGEREVTVTGRDTQPATTRGDGAAAGNS